MAIAKPPAADESVSGRIDRVSPADLVMLAMDTGPVPQQLGALMLLEPGTTLERRTSLDPAALQRLIADRVRAIPRMRQRLVWPPAGCGRPLWIDDPTYDAAQQIRQLRCPAPGDDRALLDLLAAVVTDPLPMTRPLWTAALVTDLADGAVGLVVVLHHALADGIGGLAVLAHLVDQSWADATHPSSGRSFPEPAPSWSVLAADAQNERRAALSRLLSVLRGLRTSLSGAGGWHAPAAAPCSIISRTGPRRRLAVARADLGQLRAAAQRHGGTVNDALLGAVTGALRTLLEHRGERMNTFRVTIPVTVRRPLAGSAQAAELGNEVAPLVVGLPGDGDPGTRLERIAVIVRAARAQLTGPSLVVLMGPVFQAFAGLRLYHLYLNHQRRFHTLVSNVRGPQGSVSLAGAPVRQLIPVSVAEAGNVTVNFVALSYAGTLTITIVADRDLVPDLQDLASFLQAELDAEIAGR